jgi:signal transduction histidine kinase
MRQSGPRDEFEAFLWGEVVLVGLLAASLALFLTNPSLRVPHHLPELKLVLATVFTLCAGLVALLCATRFSLEGRRFDLLLCAGFFAIAVSWAAFSLAPAIAGVPWHRTELWANLGGVLLGWTLIACAPLARGTTDRRPAVLASVLFALTTVLAVIWTVSWTIGPSLPNLGIAGADQQVPPQLTGLITVLALVNLLAVIGFAHRFRQHGEDLDRWLALGATLTLFASLHFVFSPLAGFTAVTQGDFLRLMAYGVLLAGVWRAIRSSEFGRAVAEERSRVARDIHDGLAQYLFAISTHTSMLELGADLQATLPQLKEAALAAQREARFAVLALSSAGGSAEFESALRRYVDFLTADGALEVELDFDSNIDLAPDEQIEVFRIVQESLGNARRHAHARRAWVTIGRRNGDRLVSVRDDGDGFEPQVAVGGQGLANMQARATSIGGAFTLASSPGRGTALQVILRS